MGARPSSDTSWLDRYATSRSARHALWFPLRWRTRYCDRRLRRFRDGNMCLFPGRSERSLIRTGSVPLSKVFPTIRRVTSACYYPCGSALSSIAEERRIRVCSITSAAHHGVHKAHICDRLHLGKRDDIPMMKTFNSVWRQRAS